MATGDLSDMVGRIRAALPSRWFPLPSPATSLSAPVGVFSVGTSPIGTVVTPAQTNTPVLDGLLSGLAGAWSWLYGLISYANLQTRIATATDVWLDLTALDFLGTTLTRGTATDAQFRVQIEQAILAPKGTRAALVSALTNLTGRAPRVFEPANTSDTGGYTVGGVGYGVGGGYGDLQLPFQAFVVAYRPHGGGVANVSGYCNPSTFDYGAGGYGTGAIEYANPDMVQGAVTDAMIQAAVVNVMPEATIAWMAISN